MNLHAQEQAYYTLPDLHATDVTGTRLTTPVAGWEASFDRGTTWHPAGPHPDYPGVPCWLIRGPHFPGAGDTNPTSGILVDRSTRPLIRLMDNPETAIEAAEQIWPQI